MSTGAAEVGARGRERGKAGDQTRGRKRRVEYRMINAELQIYWLWGASEVLVEFSAICAGATHSQLSASQSQL